MEAEIYLTKFNETENRSLIIDSDEYSIWAYVLNSEDEIEFEGFLCSRGALVNSISEVKEFLENDFQPPLIKEIANEFSIQYGIKSEDLKIVWNNNMIQISINGEEFLKMDTLNGKSYSKAVSEFGFYGIPFNE